jgi:acetylornithine deacetylase
MLHQKLKHQSISLLKRLISIKSFSREENKSADQINSFFQENGISTYRKYNNVWSYNAAYKEYLPTLLLNSHHDTVHPNNSWTSDPFLPTEKDGKIIGLGSNDAGGSLVSLIATFMHFYNKKNLNFNLIFSATAEEENSGYHGIESILEEVGKIDFVIVGEPTEMKMAIAEKGLIVLDCIAKGKAGHAARDGGENAIVNAMKDIEWFHSYKFPRESKLLGPVRMTVTIIEAGSLHNIIPDTCKFTVDIRSTDAYGNQEIIEMIKQHINCEIKPRSTRLKPSKIDMNHVLIKASKNIGIPLFGSVTTSDQAVRPYPSVKIGPGMSERSHTADEFIYVSEIHKGIDKYIELLENINVII